MFTRILLWSHLVLDFCWGFCLITNSISLLITVVCSCLLFLYDSLLGECMFLGVHPFFLLCAFCGGGGGLVAKLCLTLITPWTVVCHAPLFMGFFQARILEWVAISFSRAYSQPREWTRVFYIPGGLLHCRWNLYQLSHQGSLCAFYWLIIIHSNLLWFFLWYFGVLIVTSFISDFIHLGPVFFSWWVWLKFYQFCLSFQRISF